MDIEDIIRREALNHITVLEALTSFGNLDTTDFEPTLTPDEVSQTLHESFKAVEEEVANFLCAFPSTERHLQIGKKIILRYFSPNLVKIKNEFRLPSFTEENMDEGKVVNKAWESFRDIYKQTASTLVKAIKGSQWPPEMSCLLTTNEEEDERRELSLVVRRTTTQLLLTGLLAKQVYGLVMAKLHWESRHEVYSQAFNALKDYKISRELKTAERKARISLEIKEEALASLAKEVKCYQGLQERWVKESESWNEDSEGMTYPYPVVHTNYIDWALGSNHLETLLPEATAAIKGLLRDLLDFLPKTENMKGEFKKFEGEAEVLSNRFYEQMNQIKHGLMEPDTTTLNPAKMNLGVPKQISGAQQLSISISLLIHEATALNVDLCELTAIYNKLGGAYRENTIQMLKEKLEVIKRKKESMKLFPEQEVSRVYTMMDTIDKKISRLETFISLEEEKAEPTATAREGMIQGPEKSRDLGSEKTLSRKCDFKNCQSTDHYTRRCDNLKPGKIQEDIQHMVQDAGLCLRCLGDRSYEYHDERCKGGYKRPKDSKWVKTDCSTCFATLPSGEAININKRICFHTLDTVKERNQKKRYPSRVISTPKIKRIKELKEEGNMRDDVAPQLDGARTSNHTSVKFEKEFNRASLIEDHQTEENGRSISQLSENNPTLRPELGKRMDTTSYIKMELTSPEPLDWATESAEEDEQPTTIGGEGTN